jgi:hypothetical protein
LITEKQYDDQVKIILLGNWKIPKIWVRSSK